MPYCLVKKKLTLGNDTHTKPSFPPNIKLYQISRHHIPEDNLPSISRQNYKTISNNT